MLSSQARTLTEEVIPDLQFAGVPIDTNLPEGVPYLQGFVERLSELGPI